jgi:hypothetical protein
VPVSAATISAISPEVGYIGKSVTVTITGTNFTSEEGYVWLEKTGENSIDASIKTWENTRIVCKFTFSSGIDTGKWAVVVKPYDSTKVVKSNAFTITETMSLSSISPTSGAVDNDDIDFTITGTGLSDVTDVYLSNDDYDDIEATNVDATSSTRVKGTFDLSDAEEDTYEVCVVDSLDAEECDLTFKISTDAYGSIDFSSTPSGASIYVDGAYLGTTPETADDLEEGSYKIVLRKSGYNDWGKVVRVTEGDTTEINAVLEILTTSAPTTLRTTVPTTVRTTARSTLQLPTTWPSATPTTQASPVDPALIAGTVCLVFLAFRKD